MKLVRSVVTWRMVSVWATSPKITSWSATRPGQAHGVDRHLAVHQRGGARGGARRRVELRRVVVLDDLGAGHDLRRLGGEAHHQHRADREVGRRRRPCPGAPATACAQRRPSDQPVVPMTTCTPAVDGQLRVADRLVGEREVDEHVGVVEHVGERRAERRIGAAGQLHVVRAFDGGAGRRPHAPGGAGDGDPDHAARSSPCGSATAAARQRSRRPGRARLAGARDLLDRGAERVLVRADAGRGQPTGRPQLVDERAHVVHRHGVDALHDLVGLQQRQAEQQRAAEAVHPRAGGLHAQHDPRLDVLARTHELRLGGGLLAQALELVADDLHRLDEVVRARADVEADLARVGVLAGERVDA